MKNIRVEVFEDILIGSGLIVSLSDLRTILSVIILVLDIIWILYKGIKIVVTKIHNKDIKGAIDDAKKTVEEVKEHIDKYGDRQDTK